MYDDKVRARPRETMEANLNILREEGVQDGGAIPAILDRVSWTESLEEAAAFADVVIECIVEDLAVKQDYFQKLDALCPLSTVLTTNTSAISVTEIAGKAVHKERIIGTHFWNPAYLVPLVEVIRTKYVSEETVAAVFQLMEEAGKKPVLVKKDVPGFLANRMQHALFREAISIVENGIAEAGDVDDAIKYGFGKLVFVIRKDFEQDFRDKIISKYEGHIPCELVFQELDALPEGFTCPADRTKPWGTNHAVMMGADVIKEPFAVINCDDFYGRDSFQVMGKFLSELPEDSKNVYSMVGFRIGNTLSESGTVSRGLCSTDANNLLTSVVERTKIQRMDGEVKYIDDNGEWTATPDTTPVSMNFWGFTPDYFAYSQEFFKTFLSDSKNMENLKSEFFIPLMVDKLINDGTATVEVLDTNSKWFGVTYPEDRQSVVDKIKALVDAGEYPAKLF